MSLIKCPECGKVFSDRAAHCPQCGLPTSDALEMIMAAPALSTPLEGENPTANTGAAAPSNSPEGVSSPSGGSEAPSGGSSAPTLEPVQPPYYPPRYEERSVEPKKQRNLLTYILIVAVIVLAIVCIALVFTTSGVLNSDEAEEADSVATMQMLPPDTTPAKVEEEPVVKPVIRTAVPEEIPAESEEIEIEAPAPASAPASVEPAPAPAPAPAPTPEGE